MSLQPFRLPRVYPILDTRLVRAAGCSPFEAAIAMRDGGAQILQFRHKDFWDGSTVDLAARIGEEMRSSGVLFLLNDRADYAALLRSGLHVGQDDIAPQDARKLLGPDSVVGFSTHNLEQLHLVETIDLQYVAFGPVFSTASKYRPDPIVGLELLRAARDLTRRPLVAIGGITRSAAPLVWEQGADSIALISDLLPEPCHPGAIRERMSEWGRLAGSQ